MGTVLGASTLPFYDQPGDHAGNLLTGALVGAAGGLVLAILDSGASGGHEEADLALPFQRVRETSFGLEQTRRIGRIQSTRQTRRIHEDLIGRRSQSPVGAPILPTAFWTPVVSLTW